MRQIVPVVLNQSLVGSALWASASAFARGSCEHPGIPSAGARARACSSYGSFSGVHLVQGIGVQDFSYGMISLVERESLGSKKHTELMSFERVPRFL